MLLNIFVVNVYCTGLVLESHPLDLDIAFFSDDKMAGGSFQMRGINVATMLQEWGREATHNQTRIRATAYTSITELLEAKFNVVVFVKLTSKRQKTLKYVKLIRAHAPEALLVLDVVDGVCTGPTTGKASAYNFSGVITCVDRGREDPCVKFGKYHSVIEHQHGNFYGYVKNVTSIRAKPKRVVAGPIERIEKEEFCKPFKVIKKEVESQGMTFDCIATSGFRERRKMLARGTNTSKYEVKRLAYIPPYFNANVHLFYKLFASYDIMIVANKNEFKETNASPTNQRFLNVMSAGVPAIAINTVKVGEYSYPASVPDMNSVIPMLNKIVANASFRIQLHEQGLANAELYSPSVVADRYVSFFRKLLSRDS